MKDCLLRCMSRLVHLCDIAISPMDFRFRGKSGRAADITGTTEFDPKRSSGGSQSRSAAIFRPSDA